jgi:hypothetical protein
LSALEAEQTLAEGCGVYLPDLEGPRAMPDDPRQKVMRLIPGGKNEEPKR